MERITGLHRFIPRPTHHLAGRVKISPADSGGPLVLTFGGFQNLLAPLLLSLHPPNPRQVCRSHMLSSPSCLQIFKSIGNVLDQSVSDWTLNTGLPLDQFVPQVKDAILRMHDEYYSRKRPEIPFDDLVYRSAYLYKYAPANALAVEAVLNDDAKDQRLISSLLTSQQRISLCCLGGGPGSEIVGVAKWIVRQQLGATQLEVVVTDKYPQWKGQWESVRDTLNATVSAKRPPLVVSRGVARVDVINPVSARLPVLGQGFDLYVVSYVVSHIYTPEGLARFRQFMRSVIDSAPKDSKFLFIDRHEPNWKTAVTTLLDYPGIQISGPYSSISGSPGDTQEEKTDLGVLYKGLEIYKELEISPRLGWDIFWVVGTKV